MITYDEVRSWFRYNPRTGKFTWAVCRRSQGGLTQIGQEVGVLTASGRYRHTMLQRQTYLVHRLIWLYQTGEFPAGAIDHKNGNGLDNRWSNLRLTDSVSNQQNQRRAHDGSLSGLLGAWPASSGNGKWRSAIKVDGKIRFLGYFPTAEDAHRAYKKAKRELHASCTI